MTSRLEQLRIAARLRRVLARRAAYDASSPEARSSWRRARLDELRRHAVERSPFYRRHHHGDTASPLTELPVVTKAELLAHFDEVVTDRSLSLASIEAHVRTGDPGAPLAGRYRVGSSSGSTGRPGLVPFNRHEWVDLLAAAARSRAVIGPATGVDGRSRSAKVGSPSPWHISVQLPATLEDPRRSSLRLSVTRPVEEIARALDTRSPDILTAYPSVLRRLATAQLDGRLSIAPAQVMSGGEVLTAGTRRLITEAWARKPFDQYVSGEAGFLAVECPAHDGLHVLDDHVVLEPVDGEGRPVEAGDTGARVLLTALWSRTVPLIRYALDDRIRLADGPCPCGRATPRLAAIEGTARELVPLQSPNGTVDVHPTAFTPPLDAAPIGGWQVRHTPRRLRIEVVEPRPGCSTEDLRTAVAASLAAAGATEVEVEVVVVPELSHPDGSGKASRIVAGGA